MSFESRLRESRKEAGFTQDAISSKLRIERTRYAKWESGKAIPSIEFLSEICDLLGVSADYLIGRTSDKHLSIIKTPAELADVGVLEVEKIGNGELTSDEVAAIRAMLARENNRG